MAVWADGTTHKIMHITVADAREIISGGGKRSCYPAEVVWSGEHGVTHHKLTVKRRADRGLLMSLYEQEAQVCSVKVEWVGPEAHAAGAREQGGRGQSGRDDDHRR